MDEVGRRLPAGCATHVKVEHDRVGILEPFLVDTVSRFFVLPLQIGGVLHGCMETRVPRGEAMRGQRLETERSGKRPKNVRMKNLKSTISPPTTP